MNQNSAFIWLPAIEAAGVRSPRTIMLPYDHLALVPMLDGGKPSAYFDTVVEHVKGLAEGRYPVFLRTDLSSAKHDGPKAYLAKGPEDVKQVLFNLLMDNEMKFFMSARPMGIMIREFLELDAAFTAFDGLPIAREWRLFVDGEKLLCAHPYWPAYALENCAGLPEGWEAMLEEHHREPPIVRAHLAREAIKVAKALGGEWSADFAQDKDGNWWLTDMATARDSYHWPECERIQTKHAEPA